MGYDMKTALKTILVGLFIVFVGVLVSCAVFALYIFQVFVTKLTGYSNIGRAAVLVLVFAIIGAAFYAYVEYSSN